MNKDQALNTFSDPKKMQDLSDGVLRVLTSPEFLDQVRQVNSSPPETRLQEASKRLTPEALKKNRNSRTRKYSTKQSLL
jgi:hypothetical protein